MRVNHVIVHKGINETGLTSSHMYLQMKCDIRIYFKILQTKKENKREGGREEGRKMNMVVVGVGEMNETKVAKC